MVKQGFSRFTMKPGDEALVASMLAKGGEKIDGLIAARADTIATADGRQVFDRTALR